MTGVEMKKKQWALRTAFSGVLCAVLILAAGCNSATVTNNVEQNGRDPSRRSETSQTDLSNQTSQTGTSNQISQTGTSNQTSQTAGSNEGALTAAGSETAESARIPALEETVTDEYTEKSVRIYRDTLTDDTAQIRFYNETPNVAYIGIREYFDLMLGGGLEVYNNGDGTYTLVNAQGGSARVDIEKGIVSSMDMPAFENYYADAQEGAASSFKDSPAPYLRLREVVYEGDPEPVEFDLGKLGIMIHADSEEVWLPVSILTSWLTDIAQNIVVFNGNYLYISRGIPVYEMDEGCYSTDYIDSILTGNPREEDLTSYSYGDLGFIFRYMYGYPGRCGFDTEILRNEGLDAALGAYGEIGEEIKEELTSRDFRKFWFGMYRLSEGPLEDGHNSTTLPTAVVDAENEKYQAFREYTWSMFDDHAPSEFIRKISDAAGGIYEARPEDYSGEGYYKHGDTAVILVRGFTVSEGEWKEFYQNGGDLPSDTMGAVARGLRKASEDAEIKNVVLDLATNPGGYSDAAAGVIALLTGRDYLCGYNELCKQPFKVYFDVDRNLDGEFNEEDNEVSYDFHYAVLTSGASFSCGNMFPFLVKDEGGMVIGERSGGGSCSIQKAVLSEGFEINISGCKFKLTDNKGSDLESGITPDITLETGVKTEKNEITGEVMTFPDYAAFGDLDRICEAVSTWFEEME